MGDSETAILGLPCETGRHAPVAGVDQSYLIAVVLENPASHDRQIDPFHGPVEMDHEGIAAACSRALGIPVRYEPISIEEFAAALASLGRSPHLIQHLSNVAVDYRDGIFAGTDNLIEVIGNRTPLTVENFVAERRQLSNETAQGRRGLEGLMPIASGGRECAWTWARGGFLRSTAYRSTSRNTAPAYRYCCCTGGRIRRPCGGTRRRFWSSTASV
jgi:hypothetical protein